MMGRNFSQKLCELWEQWYNDQGSRYLIAQNTNKTLLKLMPSKETVGDYKIF